MPPDPLTSDTIEIGYVARAHGIRGEIFAATHDPDSTTLEEADAVYIAGTRYAVEHSRPMKEGWLLALEGVLDRNLAETLRGKTISVDRALISVEPGEVILSDLVGFAVRLPDGTSWGTVTAVEIGPQDRLIVCDHRVERQVPYVPELVADVDVPARVIVVTPLDDWPEEPLPRLRGAKP
jgi:16S rRNA processing protein RimM